ncbi:ribosome-inactivating protein lychnin [Striga asiatica]|uniref:rRNA N-glycosylase n=1 Tax=Striga asiatica TaxID=4170 RepID=A0A5A7Q490_STRAF|nr:ribosome-inactivating protein lychnin [Striga asiatica]
MEYTDILRQLRAMFEAQGGEILEIPTLPREDGKGKGLYIKLHLRYDTSSFILFMRASDLYVIGYESEVELVSLKPDKERAQEMDKHFASRDHNFNFEKGHGWQNVYSSLVRASTTPAPPHSRSQ